jgi:hypothetical protein
MSDWKIPPYEQPTKSHKLEDETLKVKITEWGHGDWHPTDEREEFMGYDKESESFLDWSGQKTKVKTSTRDINGFIEIKEDK